MIRRRRPLSLIVFACGLASCARSTAPDERSAIVTVQAQTITASVDPAGGVTWMHFAVPLSIENTGSTPLSFAYCASRVEARAGDSWSAAWEPICTLDSSVPIDVRPGERREFTVTVQASVEGPGGPQWRAAQIAGAYRFVAGVAFAGATGLVPTVASNPFTLGTE